MTRYRYLSFNRNQTMGVSSTVGSRNLTSYMVTYKPTCITSPWDCA